MDYLSFQLLHLYANIHEVLILNLTTEENRNFFFDVSNLLSITIENVINKYETEFKELTRIWHLKI